MAMSIINFRVINIFWSKFSFFPILSTIDKVKPYSVLSGLGMVSTLGYIVCCILLCN